MKSNKKEETTNYHSPFYEFRCHSCRYKWVQVVQPYRGHNVKECPRCESSKFVFEGAV